ncbi:hypothetical protein EJ03DRAFT_217453 [Teratosphaeria nubilosa]|uniref:Uncharacterized protein n=1 Tax=Teratosphaeria nubilosa TaxID=161662 RepID=A0A6G1KX42_9PEZI|nr:hypothetical protein EJ03DRAFT_217453 [Teratosphaeria nubilosa]
MAALVQSRNSVSVAPNITLVTRNSPRHSQHEHRSCADALRQSPPYHTVNCIRRQHSPGDLCIPDNYITSKATSIKPRSQDHHLQQLSSHQRAHAATTIFEATELTSISEGCYRHTEAIEPTSTSENCGSQKSSPPQRRHTTVAAEDLIAKHTTKSD